MANLLQDGADWLAGQLEDHASRSVVYRRGVVASAAIAGTVSHQEYEVTDEETGLPLRLQITDWTIRTSLLVLSGNPITPQPGDQLEETLGAVTIKYEVLAVGKLPPSQWADTSGTLTIIHTKRIT